ncbi:MAG: hypothetical protein CMF73_16115 [Maricaulis sp.]|nr:hypothetical protein [Maricaulis sp.]
MEFVPLHAFLLRREKVPKSGGRGGLVYWYRDLPLTLTLSQGKGKRPIGTALQVRSFSMG